MYPELCILCADLVRILFALLGELILIASIASPDWMTCKFAVNATFASEKPTATKIGLWTQNVTDDEAVYFVMTGLQPITMLWLLLSSAIVVCWVVSFFINVRRLYISPLYTWMWTKTLMACEVVVIITFISASQLRFRRIEKIHDCHEDEGYRMLYATVPFYVMKLLTTSAMARMVLKLNQEFARFQAEGREIATIEIENQGDDDPESTAIEEETQGAEDIATVAAEAESQGNGDTTTTATAATEGENQRNEDTATATTATAATEAENQKNGDTTTTASAATEGENQGNEDTATAASAATEGEENQKNGDTTTTASAATEGEENQGDEHTATAT
ncbi:uncharacterized protein [Oscarella lobularis]|uniref:uncharacterized protein n=1 Tax=Oscarella lobularis TaxID=121494 RepID=UPI0033130D3E